MRPDEHGDDYPRICEDDGLYLPEIKPHSIQKIRLHNRYAEVFSAAVTNSWAQRAYIGLYAGAGRARLKGSGQIVETSALAVLRQPHPFTHYIYVDSNADCTNALRARINNLGLSEKTAVICGDVDASAAKVRKSLPRFSKNAGLLSFCFIDPFDIRIQFETIKQLSNGIKLDLLILLMLGVDARRNMQMYYEDITSTRVADMINCPEWRDEYRASGGRHLIQYLLKRFDQAMTGIRYLSAGEDVHPVKLVDKNVLQYVLAFYSKHDLGKRLWNEARKGVTPQLDLL